MSENGILQAEQRVREMNMMARQYTEQGNRFIQQGQNTRTASRPQNQQQTRFEPVRRGGGGPAGQNAVPAHKPEPVHIPEQPPSDPPRVQKGQSADINALFSDFNMDGEKLMIMLIMYLLIKEKADIKLILALGYLLL